MQNIILFIFSVFLVSAASLIVLNAMTVPSVVEKRVSKLVAADKENLLQLRRFGVTE